VADDVELAGGVRDAERGRAYDAEGASVGRPSERDAPPASHGATHPTRKDHES